MTAPQEPRRQKITQCHCGCARSVHGGGIGPCQLCDCGVYAVRTAPRPAAPVAQEPPVWRCACGHPDGLHDNLVGACAKCPCPGFAKGLHRKQPVVTAASSPDASGTAMTAERLAELRSRITYEYSCVDTMHRELLAEVERLHAAEEPSDVGPYPIGSPEFHIWQDGHRNGYKSERRMWRSFTGCKYPQDVVGRAAADRAAGWVRVRADDAAVERMAKHLYTADGYFPWAVESERQRDRYRTKARAVLAALLEDQ